MTHERKKNGPNIFNCNGPNCHKNFEGSGDFSESWSEAQDAGWVNAIEADDTWSHYCPACKHIVGD